MNKLSDSGALITPDGAFRPCGDGDHQLIAADLVNLFAPEQLRGALVIYPDGRWVQDCGPLPLTDEQRVQLGFIAEFPASGLRRAALDILDVNQQVARRIA
jgi:hypothetical protein